MPEVKKQPHSINAILNDVIQRVNDDTQRLRILEQSAESLTSRVNGVEQGILQSRNDMQKAISEINEGINALDERLGKTENTMKEVITHMKKLVTESQLKELQSLIELYNPVKSNFVTREEMEKLVKEKAKKPK